MRKAAESALAAVPDERSVGTPVEPEKDGLGLKLDRKPIEDRAANAPQRIPH